MLDRCNTYGMPGLWLRAYQMPGVQNQSTTILVRLGGRTDAKDFKTLPLNVDQPVRFIQRPGSGHDIPAVLFPDDGTTVRIVERIVKEIGELTENDLLGGTPDIATPELVRYHLGMVNNIVPPPWDEVVSLYVLEYQPKAKAV